METSIFTLAGKEQVSNGVSHGAATTGTREGLGRGNHDKGRLIEVQPRAAEGHPGSPLCRSTLVLLGVSKDIPGTDPSRVAGISTLSSGSLTHTLALDQSWRHTKLCPHHSSPSSFFSEDAVSLQS